MKCKLTIPERLKDLRVEHGLSLEQLAEATQISKSALSAYEVDDKREIGSYNLCALAEFYNVTTDYILGLSETKQPSPLSAESLRISDDAVKVLQEGNHNPMLLSEILTNDNFLRFMVDAEVYVDGNVATQFHTLNKMMEAQRTLYIKKLHLGDYNLQVETLNKISINEDAFFEHTLSEDIVRIMRELRKMHLGDIESRADTTIVDKMVATVDEVAGFQGTPLQKFKLIFQKLLGAKDIKLSSNADEQLEAALSSDLLKPVEPNRKKKRK